MSEKSNDTKFQREPLKEVLTDKDDVFVVFDFFKTWDIEIPDYLKKACNEYSSLLEQAESNKVEEEQIVTAQNIFRVALCRAIYDVKDEPVFQEELLHNAVENSRQIVLFDDFNNSIEKDLTE
ncbi:hypothetical protein EBR43_03850 [bacterium]|nr:hypothetical protein [bacterium]